MRKEATRDNCCDCRKTLKARIFRLIMTYNQLILLYVEIDKTLYQDFFDSLAIYQQIFRPVKCFDITTNRNCGLRFGSFFQFEGFPPLSIDPVLVLGVSLPALCSFSLKAGLGRF